MARLQKRQNRKQRQPKPRLDLLPVELQLVILETVSSCEDLEVLVASSPTIRAIYDRYKKTILPHVLQATLGDAFVEACMLQHWRSNLDNYGQDKDNEPEVRHTISPGCWTKGPYRHVQLKFIHDWNEHATASTEDQIQNMKHLLTAEDFEQIKTLYSATVKPLSRLLIEAPAPEHDFANLYVHFEPDPTPLDPRHVTASETQRIMRTLYRYEICCRLYGPDIRSEGCQLINMGRSHREMMKRDFFSTFDASENEEFDVVYSGLALELHKFFHVIEGNMAWKRVLRGRLMRSFTFTPQRNPCHIRTFRTLGLHGVTAGALSMGLELLSTIRSAATADEVAAILVARNPPELSNFMWDAIGCLEESYHFNSPKGRDLGWPESWSDEFWK